MNVHRTATSTIVRAPAKLNLFFEVLGKRSDGYHEVETLMVPVGLWDDVVARDDPSGAVTIGCRWAAPAGNAPTALAPTALAPTALGVLPPAAENLATKAVERLRARAGVAAGISLEIVKRIPSAAGLGGASSDAAAALVAANAVWNLGWDRAALALVAAELGSDVPFFLYDRPAVCRGRGERIEPVAGLGSLDYVIVRPPEGLATAEVYARCEAPREPRRVEALVSALRRGDTRRLVGLVHNRLQGAASSLSCWIARLEREFARQECLAAQMSGSGSSYFGICRHARHARRVAQRLQARGVGQVFAVSGCG
jgi:4-diphosphocytidyl-2-C-methyl-D-erythritol kinase